MKHNKLFLLLIPVFLISLALGTNAFALYVGQEIKFQYGLGTSVTGGGEFTVTDANNGAFLLRTFCMETNEHVNDSHTFIVGGISDSATLGGSGGPNPDPLDPLTAYLFWEFTQGTLTDIDGNLYTGTKTDQVDLQRAIWYFEEENGGENNRFAEKADSVGWTDIGSVRVINLETLNGANAQDQLVVAMPEPATMLLSSLGLLGMGFYLRRKYIKA